MRLKGLFFILLLFCAFSVQANTPEQQRTWFEEARQALKKHDYRSYQSLREQLDGYPLTPYLDIWHARKLLEKGNEAVVESTLAAHADIPEAASLRRAWIRYLAHHGNWPKIIELFEQYPAARARLPEIAMVAAWHAGERKRALAQFSAQWVKARKSSSFAATVQRAWRSAGHPTVDERWQRINHYARHGKWKRIKHEARQLPKGQQPLIAYWRQLQRSPEQLLGKWPETMPAVAAELILSDGLIRLSRSDAGRAWQLLHQLEAKLNIAESRLLKLKQRLALRAARQHIAAASDWLKALPDSMQSEDSRSWQVRLHILHQQWQQAIAAIDAMPEREHKQSRWIYWKARALEASGNRELAQPLYLLLANDRGYYSFLSSERLGVPLKFNSSRIEAVATDIDSLAERPAMQRAYEWLQLKQANKAAREWYLALRNSSREQWRAAAKLALNWGWYNQSIRAAYRADEHDALEARFPLGFEDAVETAAKESGLSSASIWSIIRQESAFNDQAVSYAGAKGLMQLMPATARGVARKIKLGSRHPDLFSPATNVRLGSAYLAEMNERFGNMALAAAAYNAGPHRVSLWLERSPFSEAEAWVEAIPFSETRRYVQQVMAFIAVYEWRQAKEPSSLISRIKTVEKVSLNEKR